VTTIAVTPGLQIGRVFVRTFRLLQGRPVTFLCLAVVFAAITNGPSAWLASRVPQLDPAVAATDVGGVFRRLGWLELFSVLFSGFATVLSGVGAEVAADEAAGRPGDLGRTLSTLLRDALPLYAVGVLMTVGVVLGSILLIVPGIIASMAWCVAGPILVLERTSITGAFSRSADLTRNNRGALFLLFLIYGVAGAALTFAVRALAGESLLASRPVSPLYMFAIQPALGAVLAAFHTPLLAAIYFELREVKEGVVAEGLAAVFD
jgi:hypothetical protein